MKKITAKYIKNYLDENFGGARHDVKIMAKAINEISKIYSVNDPTDAFLYIIGDANTVPGEMFSSYGFDTREGREFRDTFSNIYYSYE